MDEFKIGDIVRRKSHSGDIVFKIADITQDETGNSFCMLKGLHMRLMADAPLDDLVHVDGHYLRNEIVNMENMYRNSLKRVLARRDREKERLVQDRAEVAKKYTFFDLPGRVLHIDGDEDYLRMCLKTYSQLNIEAVGRHIEEEKQPDAVKNLLEEYRPDILVLTGHDALIGGGKKEFSNVNHYRTSKYFIQAVKNARQVNPARDDLVIFAGACQSCFEAILSAGANFASSPNRILIHAYDPVFIAEKIAFTPINKTVDISDAISASVTGIEGVGGLETRGKFRLGLPKTPY